MDREQVKGILAPYCPPLSPSQVEVIAEEIAKYSEKPAAVTTSTPEPDVAPKPVHSKPSRKS